MSYNAAMSRSDGHVPSSLEGVEDASNVLILAPSMELSDGAACARVLSAGDVDGSNLLHVALTDTPDNRLGALRSHLGEVQPLNLAFVTVGDHARSVAATSPDGFATEIGDPGVTSETISTPGDLTGLGMKISSIISEWEGDETDVIVCFHSLTTLLQYAEVRQVFRFLHVLTGRLDVVDARAHYHLDPGAHDEKDVNTLKALFDGVVTFESGEWSVQTR